MKKLLKILRISFLILVFVIAIFFVWFYFIIQLPEPEIDESLIHTEELIIVNDSHFIYQDASLIKNTHGLWEMYVSGSPEELGIKNGILAQHLIRIQEEAFVKQIKKMIPSQSYLGFLKYVASLINHQLPEYIPEEYLKEIKAVSLFASDDFNFIGSHYARLLNYHAAHDIGHAMQNLHLVECTAFGVNHELSADKQLLLGRNFDFYVGDDFAKNKIIMFVNPQSGIPFASITWGGMIGVLSGINQQGLTVTLNSAKSEIPLFAKTPVSIIAREILQYAKTIDEAYEIAKKHPSFVAESFMVSSAIDKEMAIIEKTPDTTILFRNHSNVMVLTNHFQSNQLFDSEINQENLKENVTAYRYQRVEELLGEKKGFNEHDFAHILRDTKGLMNVDIGLGNEGAINQLIAHHSVIFKPQKNQFWISTSPYQSGEYLLYQLDTVFMNFEQVNNADNYFSGTLAADSVFLNTSYLDYLEFKSFLIKIDRGELIDVIAFEKSNPNYFYTYEVLGDYWTSQGDYKKAKIYYMRSLEMFIPNLHESLRIQNKLELLNP